MYDRENYTAVVGAGALGAMYAERIDAAGLPVVFVADGDRADRLERDGVTVNGKALTLPVLRWRRELQRPPRRVIVALKDQHVPRALPDLPSICGPETTILSVMNGIDSERQIAEALGESIAEDDGRVLHCMVAGMDAVRIGAEVTYSQLGTVFFGRRRNNPEALDERVREMQSFFSAAAIPAQTPPDMERALWNKFMLNVGINQWSAVLGATYSVFHTSESARSLMRRAMREVLEVAQARSIDLTAEDLENWFDVVATLAPENKTSMAQDIEAGRKTEVEMFAGRVIEMGRESGVATPVNEVLLDAIHTLEG